jgi:nucleolar protein 12
VDEDTDPSKHPTEDSAVLVESSAENVQEDSSSESHAGERNTRNRKRKREEDDDTIERRALQRLAEDELPSKSNGTEDQSEEDSSSSEEADKIPEEKNNEHPEEYVIPQHESLANPQEDVDLDKAGRTVFLGNVSTQAILDKSAKKTLLKHLASFLSELPSADPPHKVESLRFRSTAFDSKLPKKAAFITKELMDTTTHSTNAYAVYNTQFACREAAKRLNGTVVLNRHLRVDQIAHPAKIEHKKCVFIGNLDFVDDDSNIREDAEDRKAKKSKKRQPADVEEGLWREFSKVGIVQSVRVIRDQKTRVGKGFAYVQFMVISFPAEITFVLLSNSYKRMKILWKRHS